MYITFNNETKKVDYIGEKKPASYTDNLTLAEVETIPEKYDYLTVVNEREVTKTWTETQEELNENGEVITKEVEKSRTFVTCDLVTNFRTKPTTEQLEKIKEKIKEKRYNELCERYIRQMYSASDEFEILRKKDFNNVEFNEYYDYVESCLARAKLEVYGN